MIQSVDNEFLSINAKMTKEKKQETSLNVTNTTGPHCIKLLPEKNSGFLNQIFFSYGKVNGKIMFTRVFRFYNSFFLKFYAIGPWCTTPCMTVEMPWPTHNIYLYIYISMSSCVPNFIYITWKLWTYM